MSEFAKDYVEVAERLVKFYERFPDGRLTTERHEVTAEPDGHPRVIVTALAYRTPDDPVPGRGSSWMLLPGSTPYTRGSELENTETSAWGRAMAAVGIEVKRGIASAQEVRNKAGEDSREYNRAPRAQAPSNADGPWEGPVTKGQPPVDGSLREAADGPSFGFVVTEPVPGNERGRRVQVLCAGPLASAVAIACAAGLPASARVWGEMTRVPWKKDGKDMPPYARVLATRIATPEWTVPADLSAAPDDLDGLAW